MGYNRSLDMENFSFKENVSLKDILEVFNTKLCKEGFRYVDIPESGKWKTVRNAFEAWGFSFDVELMEISYDSGYMGSEEALFEALAPLVKKGSYVENHDDFGESRFVFDGDTMKVKTPNW